MHKFTKDMLTYANRETVYAKAMIVSRWLSAALLLVLCSAALQARASSPSRHSSNVQRQQVSLPSYPAQDTPEQYNQALYLRYYHPQTQAEAPETIIILIPGLFSGAMSMERFAHQLLEGYPSREVWVIERRANLLEDRSAALQSLRSRDPGVALRYYLRDAGTSAGFQAITAAEADFVRHWGLTVHLRDLHVVVQRARAKASRLILGGHSLGASIVSLYAAYDFTDDPLLVHSSLQTPDSAYLEARIGADLLDGLLLLDGVLGKTGGFDLAGGVVMEALGVQLSLRALQDYPQLPPFLNPTPFAQAEAIAIAAQLAPEIFSTTLSDYLVGTARRTLGEDSWWLEAARVALAAGMRRFVEQGIAEAYARSLEALGMEPRIALWGFIDSRSSLDSNASEWYFPLRLLLDTSLPDVSLQNQAGFVGNNHVAVATLVLGAEQGLVNRLEDIYPYRQARAAASPFAMHILANTSHVSILSAELNPAIALVQDWLASIP